MIKFGTSGWRGIIARDFNFTALQQASLGTALYLKENKFKKGIIVGYDTRFLGKRFAEEVSLVLAAQGIKTFLTKRDCPTPAMSAYIIKNKLDGGINITASHNPYNYSGFKFSPSWGGPALPEDTNRLEAIINGMEVPNIKKLGSIEEAKKRGLCEEVDPSTDYFKLLKENLKFETAKKRQIKVFFDAVYGTGRDYVDKMCGEFGFEVETINGHPDPYFDNKGPDPSSENLKILKERVKSYKGVSVGIATDGDADRFGIIGSSGQFIEPNKIIALLADYLFTSRKYPPDIGFARSFATGSQIDLVAEKHQLKLYENPVGFKYIGKLISEGKIIIGGEESAGLSIFNHVPEKDGILACLLMVELMSVKNASTEELIDDFHKRIGRLETKRENHTVDPELKKALSSKLGALKGSFLGKQIDRVIRMDGTKIFFKDSSWVLFRESGTEPLVRIYGEARESDDLNNLMEKARDFLLN